MPNCRNVLTAINGVLFVTLLATAPRANGQMYMDPRDNQRKTVVIQIDTSHTIALKEPEVWYQDPSKRRGVMLPAGIYTTEGEDGDFWYLRAPETLDFRIFDRPAGDNERHIPGGIALKKKGDILIPAEIYIDADANDPTKKELIFKLGHTFQDLENSKWERKF